MDPAKAWRNVVDFMRATPGATLKYEPASGEWFIDLIGGEGCMHHETLQGLSWQISQYKQSKIKPEQVPVTPKAAELRSGFVEMPQPWSHDAMRRIVREELDRKFPEQALMPWATVNGRPRKKDGKL